MVNIVNGFGETAGAALVRPSRTSTRSPSPATSIPPRSSSRHAAETLKRTTFELGGKSPNVVFADADIEEAVAGAFHAIYFHGGQCCTAGSRLFVEQKIHKEFVERLAEKAKGADASAIRSIPATEQGPQVSQEQTGQDPRLRRPGPEARAPSCSPVASASATAGFFVEPTDLRRRQGRHGHRPDEIFGPVVSVLPFKRVDEVIERANNTYYGLAAAIWTKDIDKAHLLRQTGQGRHRVGELLPRRRYHDAVRRLQDVRARAARTAKRRWSTTRELKTVTVKLG